MSMIDQLLLRLWQMFNLGVAIFCLLLIFVVIPDNGLTLCWCEPTIPTEGTK